MWAEIVKQRVAAFGHRNWIAVVDAAYPAQAGGGIETVATNADAASVVTFVRDTLLAARHVRPVARVDAELEHVSEADAPGIGALREKLQSLLGEVSVHAMPHEAIVAGLQRTAEQFHVLILKTTSMLPYTSVFFELYCGYWSDEAQMRLMRRMAGR